MCFLCNKMGPLVVYATSIDGEPRLYAHPKCIADAEVAIEEAMHA